MRLFSRISADSAIVCEIAGKRDSATLYDISCGGCMVETQSEHAEPDAEITVELNDSTQVTGIIAWRHGKNAGIKFDNVLSEDELAAMGFAVSSETFDAEDPRDRFGIPLVQRPNADEEQIPAFSSMPLSDFTPANEISDS